MRTLSKQNLPAATHAGGQMPRTHWSVILQAGSEQSTLAHQALDTLCRTYWYPLYAYLRRDGRTAHEAQDLTQGFFSHLLHGNRLESVKQRPGMKFRSWLFSSLRYYMRDEWRKAQAEKRGGGKTIISIDAEVAEERYHAEPADPIDPQKLFERKWAMELLNRVLVLLEKRYAAKGKQALFAELSPFIIGGAQFDSQRQIAERLDIAPGNVGVAINRMRERYYELLRAEIAQTVSTREEIEEELRHLGSAIGL